MIPARCEDRVKLTVSSPDLRPSLVGVLQGLAEAHALDRVITTVAFAPDGRTLRLVGRGSGRLRGLLRRRVIPHGLEEFVDCIPLGELLFQASGRIGLGDLFQHRVWMWAEPYFDRRVAERIAGRTEILYGHEHAALTSFEAQKRAGGRSVLRQVNAHFGFLDSVLDEEHDRFGVPETATYREMRQSLVRVNARKLGEYELADLIVANSSFVKRTFVEAGIPAAKVVVTPTGCPTPLLVCPPRTSRPKVVLAAGHLSFRKGTPYLLDAWRRLELAPDEAELVLAGRNMLPEGFVRDLPAGARTVGAVGAAALDELYKNASILVLPTLCEGLAHVVPEALARGLPIITTPNSGAEGLIVSGQNGWIIPTRDPDALADRILWCLRHPTELAEMSENALETARRCSLRRAVTSHVGIVLGVTDQSMASRA